MLIELQYMRITEEIIKFIENYISIIILILLIVKLKRKNCSYLIFILF